MAQKIVTLCDPHHAADEEVEGREWIVTMQGPEDTKPTTWAIDLCEDDGKTLRDLAAMLGAVGRVAGDPRRKSPKASTAPKAAPRTAPEPHAAPVYRNDAQRPVEAPRTAEGYPCPMEGCGKVSSSHSGLAAHLRGFHDGMTIAKATGQPEPYACPDCGFTSARPQGLGAHRRGAHGVVGASRQDAAGA